MATRNDSLAAEALQQLLGDNSQDDMPVILAKRNDPQLPTTYNLHDYGFEGLRRGWKNGKSTWEVYHDFVLSIDGATGNCRIPDTVRNRKRLDRLSKGESEIVKRIELDEATGLQITSEEKIDHPGTYVLLEHNLAQSTMVDSIAVRVMQMMQQMGMGAPSAQAPLAGGLSPDLEPVPEGPKPLKKKEYPRGRRPMSRMAAHEAAKSEIVPTPEPDEPAE